MSNDLRRAFDDARYASEQRSYVYGVLGLFSTDTPAQCNVAARPGFVYVRVSSAGTQSLGMAKNLGIVAIRANTPVRMRREGGVLVIVGTDYASGLWDAATGGDTLNQYGVTPHTHKIGTGLEYEIESLRLEPGRVHSENHDMTATINGFRHALGTWATGTIDLTSYIPTSGYHCWVLVGIDPTANVAVAVGSTPVILATTLAVGDLDGLDFDGYIPLGAFQVADTTTELAQYAYEARIWFDTPGAPDTVDAIVVFDDEIVFFDDEIVTA